MLECCFEARILFKPDEFVLASRLEVFEDGYKSSGED